MKMSISAKATEKEKISLSAANYMAYDESEGVVVGSSKFDLIS